MKKKLFSLGKLGTKFFSFVQIRHLEIVRLGELQSPLGITAQQEQDLLKRLARDGLIVRLKRGIYLIPDKIPPSGYWQPNEYYLIAHYMELYDANYYISGMSAFHYHRLVTQIPNEITIYNNKISGIKKIGVLKLILIKVPLKRLGGTEVIKVKNNKHVDIAILARTILDAIYDWKRFGSLPIAYQWIKKRIDDKRFIKKIIDLTIQYGNMATIRRVGYCLELFGLSQSKTKPLHQKLHSKTGWVLYDPNGKHKGKTNTKWRIIDNVGKF